MRAAGQAVPPHPAEPSPEDRLLRARLILEEAFETIEKGLGINVTIEPPGIGAGSAYCIRFKDLRMAVVRPFNMIETVDGCGDVSVVTIGTLSACGVADGPILAEIDRANLQKFGPGGHRNPETGKWEKPPDHRPPDILGRLVEQGFVTQDFVAAVTKIESEPAAESPAAAEAETPPALGMV